MATITLPGLSTGIDTNALITQLMAVESRRLATYKVKQSNFEKQQTALDSVRSKVAALKTATSALADIDNLNVFSTTSSDTDKITVSASSNANPGSHSIEVNQLATTETWIQDGSTFSYKTDFVGTGTFIYTYNHQQRAINTTANETTLEDLVNLINNDTNNPGVTASLLYHGGKYLLMLSGRDAGEEYQISVDTKYTEVWKSQTALTSSGLNAGLATKITELDQFIANNGLVGSEKITITGKNHWGTNLAPTDLNITANTTVGQLIDAINAQFDGTATARLVNGQIVLTDHIQDTSGLQISLSYDNGTGDTSMNLPVMAVSTEGGGTPTTILGSFTKTQSAQSSKIKIDGYPTSSNGEVQRLTKGSTAISGTFRLTYNGQTTEDISYNATTAAIQAALEALPNINPGDIVVSGAGLDQNGDTNFTFLAADGDTKMLSIDTSNLTFESTDTAYFSEIIKGNNGYIERNTNSISDALSGLTLNLHDVTDPDKPVKVAISRNTSTVSQKIQSLVKAYNDLLTELKTQTEYDAASKKMGILSSDMGVSYIKSQTKNPFLGIAPGFISTADSFVQASDIGITFDGEGMMQFDAKVFDNAIRDDFNGVLNLLGANKISDNESGVIQFYSASKKYTTAGVYDVQVDINESHQITAVRIKRSTETEFRTNSSWSGNLITGISTFDSDGKPIYPENGLQLTVDTSQPAGTYSATIVVKQGMVNILDTYIKDVLAANGRIDISRDVLDEKIRAIKDKISKEEARLDKYKQRLVDKFARLERTISTLQQQFTSINAAAGTLVQ